MSGLRMAKQIDRVPSMRVALDREEELRFERLMDSITLVDMHEHPMVLTEDVHELRAYFRSHEYEWGFEAVRHGGWTAVATANGLSCGANASEGSYARFEDLLEELALMQADLTVHPEVRRVACADD